MIQKEKNWKNYLHNPHNRLVDRIVDQLTLPKENKEIFEDFQKKFKDEDEVAYSKTIEMIKNLL